MMAKGMFAADPPHPSLPATMHLMFGAEPNITSNARPNIAYKFEAYNVWSTTKHCIQCWERS